MDNIYKYKVWCNTDSKWEYVYSESNSETALSCPANTSHTVDDTKLSIDQKLEREIQKHQSVLSQDGLTSRPLGFSFVATKNSTTTHDFKIDEVISLRGGFLETDKHVFGDSFKIHLVDVDGVYYPAETVLQDYVKNWQCRKNGENELKDESITDPLPIDIYMRVIYTSVGTVDDVEAGLTLYGYK